MQRTSPPTPDQQPPASPDTLEKGKCLNAVIRHYIDVDSLPDLDATPPRCLGSPVSPLTTPGWWLSPLSGTDTLVEVDKLALVRQKLDY